ncbi:MAG: hypothetical protein GY797_37065 [Deltaproteobacteria bacterium]|nr:hypothetical protein [Deltaproteobacteria bacterium]
MKNYGRYHKERKEDIHQGLLLVTGKDVGKGRHDVWIGALEGVRSSGFLDLFKL